MSRRSRLSRLARVALALAPAASPLLAEPAPAPEGIPSAVERCWTLAVEDTAAAEELTRTALAIWLPEPASPAASVPVAELRLCRGYVREQLGRPVEAAADYQLAVEDGERLGDAKLLAVAIALRGELAYYRGAFDAALADLNRAHALEVELGRPSRQRYILNAIANVYADARVGAFDRALEYYRQVLASHQAAGDRREMATGHFNLASTLERKGDLVAALAEFEQAAALDRGRGDLDEAAFDERALCAVLVKLGRAREAVSRLDGVVAHFAARGDEERLAQARLTRGIARRSVGDLDGALADLDGAAVRFAAGGNDRFLLRVEEERAEAHAARADYPAALAARTRQVALERRIAEVVRDEQTTRLRVQFDSEKKEQENLALARENELRSAALRDAERIRALQRLVIALTAALAVVLLLLALRQLARARRMQRLAMTDELTRLPNRRSFFTLAEESFAAARRAGAPLALLALDIDHFKRINDNHGHEVGDRVLQRVAHAARGALRGGDAVGRTGGEEFLALLPGSEPRVAVEVAERLRAGVAAVDVGDLAPGLAVTVSVGVAVVAAGDGDLQALARRADEALYRAKQNGRNRVELAGEPSAAPAQKASSSSPPQ